MTTRRDAATDVAFRHEHTLGRIRQLPRFRSSIPFTAGRPRPVRSSSRPFCVRFNAGFRRSVWLSLTLPSLYQRCNTRYGASG